MCGLCACLPVSQFLLLLLLLCQTLPVPLPCAPVRLSHCAMRGLTHTLTWVAMRSLRALWSSLVPLVFIFSMFAPTGGAVAEVNSQGAGVLLVKISSVLNPEGRDAAGACCAGPGKVRWDILGLRNRNHVRTFLFSNFPHHLIQPGSVPWSLFHHAACVCYQGVREFKVGFWKCGPMESSIFWV